MDEQLTTEEAQMEKIIDLLETINQNLESGGGDDNA